MKYSTGVASASAVDALSLETRVRLPQVPSQVRPQCAIRAAMRRARRRTSVGHLLPYIYCSVGEWS